MRQSERDRLTHEEGTGQSPQSGVTESGQSGTAIGTLTPSGIMYRSDLIAGGTVRGCQTSLAILEMLAMPPDDPCLLASETTLRWHRFLLPASRKVR